MRYLLLAAVLLAASGCLTGPKDCAADRPTDPATQSFAPVLEVDLATMTRTTNGVYYADLVTGTGAALSAPAVVSVTYSAFLIDGSLVDFSANGPLRLDLRSNAAPGLVEGMLGMAVGGERRIVVPSALALGACGKGPIPANATLVYLIELVSIEG